MFGLMLRVRQLAGATGFGRDEPRPSCGTIKQRIRGGYDAALQTLPLWMGAGSAQCLHAVAQ